MRFRVLRIKLLEGHSCQIVSQTIRLVGHPAPQSLQNPLIKQYTPKGCLKGSTTVPSGARALSLHLLLWRGDGATLAPAPFGGADLPRVSADFSLHSSGTGEFAGHSPATYKACSASARERHFCQVPLSQRLWARHLVPLRCCWYPNGVGTSQAPHRVHW